MRAPCPMSMVLCWIALALPAGARAPYHTPEPPRTHATAYDVHVVVQHKGQTMERCSVDLVVDGAPAGHADTLEDGRARFDGLTTERFELLVRREGYFSRRVIIYNFARRDLDETIELKRRVRWQLSGTVRGKGTLLANARVKLAAGGDAPAEAATAANGTFAFPDCFDTECRFSVEAPGFHRQSVWMANRPQLDLIVDVELRPGAEAPGAAWVRGQPDDALELRLQGRPGRAVSASNALASFFDVHRIGPAEDRPAGALAGARLTLGGGGRPEGALARADRVLQGWVQPYPKPRR